MPNRIYLPPVHASPMVLDKRTLPGLSSAVRPWRAGLFYRRHVYQLFTVDPAGVIAGHGVLESGALVFRDCAAWCVPCVLTVRPSSCQAIQSDLDLFRPCLRSELRIGQSGISFQGCTFTGKNERAEKLQKPLCSRARLRIVPSRDREYLRSRILVVSGRIFLGTPTFGNPAEPRLSPSRLVSMPASN